MVFEKFDWPNVRVTVVRFCVMCKIALKFFSLSQTISRTCSRIACFLKSLTDQTFASLFLVGALCAKLGENFFCSAKLFRMCSKIQLGGFCNV